MFSAEIWSCQRGTFESHHIKKKTRFRPDVEASDRLTCFWCFVAYRSRIKVAGSFVHLYKATRIRISSIDWLTAPGSPYQPHWTSSRLSCCTVVFNWTMLNAEERRLYLHQCGGAGRRRRHGVLAGPESSLSADRGAAASSRSLAALRVTRKYRQAAVRRREYRKLKAIVPAVSTKQTVSKVRISTSTTTTKTIYKSAISRIKTRIRALRWHWTVLGGVSSCKKLWFQSAFKTCETVCRSSVSRKRVPDDGCSDGKSTRREGSDRLWSLKLWRCRWPKRSSRLVVP